MFKYFWIFALIGLILILVMLTGFAVMDIMKNDMENGETIIDFMDYFKDEYPGLFFMWITGLALTGFISFLVWIASK